MIIDQFVTPNIDGSVQGNPGTARAGVIQDRFEKWIIWFSIHSRSTTNHSTELWAIREGLHICLGT